MTTPKTTRNQRVYHALNLIRPDHYGRLVTWCDKIPRSSEGDEIARDPEKVTCPGCIETLGPDIVGPDASDFSDGDPWII